MTELFTATEITWAVVALRMVAGMLGGALIGVERERSSNPAGLRTHILISSAACALMLLSIYLPQKTLQDGDSGRIAAQVVSGIGFLGAGAIMRFGTNVQGLTTAASLWSVAALGLLFGSGLFSAAIALLVVMLFTLVVLDKIEKKKFTKYALKILRLWIDTNDVRLKEVLSVLKNMNVLVKSIDFTQELEQETTQLKLYLKLPNNIDLKELISNLSELKHIKKIKMDQNM